MELTATSKKPLQKRELTGKLFIFAEKASV